MDEQILNKLDKIIELLNQINYKLNENKIVKKINKRNEENKELKNNLENVPLITQFLDERSIKIKVMPIEKEEDIILDQIAFFMGERFEQIKDFYACIKRNLNFVGKFKFDLKKYHQLEISSITQLCNKLHEVAFLEEYKYYKSPHYFLYAKINKMPKVINFFTGGWFERYIKKAVLLAIKEIKEKHNIEVDYSYIKNPQIILPNGDDFELDVLFQINGKMFWFEAKTGDYQRYINKYSEIARILDLPTEHTFMVLTDITKEGAIALKSLFHMNVVPVSSFYNQIVENLEQILIPNKNQI